MGWKGFSIWECVWISQQSEKRNNGSTSGSLRPSHTDHSFSFFQRYRQFPSPLFPRAMQLCDTRGAQTQSKAWAGILLVPLTHWSFCSLWNITRLRTNSSCLYGRIISVVEMSACLMAQFWLQSTATIPEYVQT